MALEITQEVIRALTSEQFERVKTWVVDDDKVRIERHKQETLVRIRELARSAHLDIRVEGTRGRPPKRGGESTKRAQH